GQLSEEEYWGMMQFTLSRTLEALAYMESQGVVHHDIKAPNIMLDAETGEPKVVDFGISNPTGVGAVKDSKNNVLGTPGHAPEDRGAGKSSGKADSFAVGGMAYDVRQGNTGKDGGKAFWYNLPNAPPFWSFAAMQFAKKTGEQ